MITNTEKEIIELLTTLATLSQSCRDAEIVANLIRFQHRTHQQSIGRFIQYAIITFSKMYDEKYYDLRNEATCRMCKEISGKVEECTLPFI